MPLPIKVPEGFTISGDAKARPTADADAAKANGGGEGGATANGKAAGGAGGHLLRLLVVVVVYLLLLVLFNPSRSTLRTAAFSTYDGLAKTPID